MPYKETAEPPRRKSSFNDENSKSREPDRSNSLLRRRRPTYHESDRRDFDDYVRKMPRPDGPEDDDGRSTTSTSKHRRHDDYYDDRKSSTDKRLTHSAAREDADRDNSRRRPPADDEDDADRASDVDRNLKRRRDNRSGHVSRSSPYRRSPGGARRRRTSSQDDEDDHRWTAEEQSVPSAEASSSTRTIRRSEDRRRPSSPPRRSYYRRPYDEEDYYRQQQRHHRGKRDHTPSPGRSPSSDKARSTVMTEEERKRKEIEDARREDLTVLVVNLALKATEKDIWQFFTRHAGKVRDIQLIKDTRSGKSKGIGYVEFHDAESVLKSLNLTGQCILNQSIRVQASQGEKNRAAKAAKQQQAEMAAQGPCRIYVGGLTDSLAAITGDELRQLFSPFGAIVSIEVPKDPYTGRNRGYGYIQFKQASEARDAMTAMHGFAIGGKEIKVGFAGDEQPRTTSTGSTVDGPMGLDLDRIADDHDDRLLHGGAVMRLALSHKLQQKSADPIPLFTSTAAQLIASGTARVGMDSVAAQLQSALAPFATNCLLLANMFTKQEAQENPEDLLAEVKEDVKNECERMGEVLKIWLDENALDGKVYIQFADSESCQKTQKALHGRSYGGIAISAKFIDEATFRQIVPSSS